MKMLPENLVELIFDILKNKSEDNHLEIKKAAGGCPKIYDTLSSFSNQSGGGIIVFGIDQDNDFELCGVYDADDLQKNIASMCKQMTPVVRPLCTVATIDDKTFVAAEIHEIDIIDKPCFYNGAGRLKGSYIRVGDSDERMTEYEIYSYEAFRQKIHDEIRTEERAEAEDIKTDSFDRYLMKLRQTKPNMSNLPLKKIMKLQGFLENGKPTLAGIMMFSDYPQSFYPQLCITAVSVQGYEIGDLGDFSQRFNDNERIEGSLPQMLDGALMFIRRNMKVKTIIDPVTAKREDRTEYPLVALREVLLNALIHRDYSMHTDLSPITIRMFKDRIEVENPGGLYGRITLDELGKTIADTRNPFIAKAMEVIGETENRFSGIPIIKRSMEEYQLPEPKFESRRGVFKVTLYNGTKKIIVDIINRDQSLSEQILEFCSDWRSRADLKERFSHLTSSYLMSFFVNPLVKQGKIALMYPEKPRSSKQQYKRV